MLTKEQKNIHVSEIGGHIQNSSAVLFVDFSKIPTKFLRQLRIMLRGMGTNLTIYKKRLVRVAFTDSKMDFDPSLYPSQAGAIFVKGDVIEMANALAKFVKDLKKSKIEMSVLGGYDIVEKKVITEKDFVVISKLPTRQVLLTQLAIVLSAPMRQLAVAIDARKKQLEESSN